MRAPRALPGGRLDAEADNPMPTRALSGLDDCLRGGVVGTNGAVRGQDPPGGNETEPRRNGCAPGHPGSWPERFGCPRRMTPAMMSTLPAACQRVSAPIGMVGENRSLSLRWSLSAYLVRTDYASGNGAGVDWDFHFRRPRMDPLHTRKPQRPRESFSSHNRPGSEAVTQPALTSWG